MIETAKAVRAWLNTFPGMMEAKTPAECIRKAWGAYGGPGSVEDFRAVLKREGFPVVEVGAFYRLTLPSKPMRAPDNTAKLHHVSISLVKRDSC